MKPADERILELLHVGNDRLWLPPKAIWRNLDIGDNWVQKRLRVLCDAGLVEVGQSDYRITDAGVAYLCGELDASELSSSGESGP